MDDEFALVAVGNMMTAPTTGLFDVDPTTKWSYVGTESGVNMIAPKWSGDESSCKSYDPRLRPWYSEAISGSKNVVVVVDGAGAASAAEFLSLKQGALAALGTLGAGDTANVVIARSNGASPDVTGDDYANDLTYDQCQTAQMLRTSTINKDLLIRYVSETEQEGGSNQADLLAAISTAQTLLSAQRTFKAAKYPNIDSSDVIIVLAATEYTGNNAAAYTSKKAELSPAAKWIVHGLEGSDIKGNWPNGPLAVNADVTNPLEVANAGFSPARYYTVEGIASTASEADSAAPFASSFYTDSSGLGLVTTVVAPVVHDGTIRGVVGIDVTAIELIADLIFESGKFTTSYAFVVDSVGQAIWHPYVGERASRENEKRGAKRRVLLLR